MTRKYISTELLIIFTALMIIANFYYIFFEKIGFLFVLLLGCIFSVCRLPLFSQSKRAISILDWSIINSVYFII